MLFRLASSPQILLSQHGTAHSTPLHQLAIKILCLPGQRQCNSSVAVPSSQVTLGLCHLTAKDRYGGSPSRLPTCVSPLVSGITDTDVTLLFLSTTPVYPA